jgi:hypothetical protein
MRAPTEPIHSAKTDPELHEWLLWQLENGSSFLSLIAEAASIAHAPDYVLLRPLLLELMRRHPHQGGAC